MTKKTDKKEAAPLSPMFAFGLDENGKPRGARFSQGSKDDIVQAALEMKCRVIQNHSAAFTAIGMKLPVGRVYASGKAFIPNIRRDLYDKLDEARQAPPEDVPGVNRIDAIAEEANEIDLRRRGLVRGLRATSVCAIYAERFMATTLEVPPT